MCKVIISKWEYILLNTVFLVTAKCTSCHSRVFIGWKENIFSFGGDDRALLQAGVHVKLIKNNEDQLYNNSMKDVIFSLNFSFSNE